MAIYVKIDGVEGTATHEEHKKWMQVESLSWGVSRSISNPTGATQNREASEPMVSEVTFVKGTDGSSPKLMQMACGEDTAGRTTKIDYVTTGSPGETILTYTLKNTMVSSYQSSSAGEVPEEVVTLNFTKIEMKYKPRSEEHKTTNTMIASYDLTTTKVG